MIEAPYTHTFNDWKNVVHGVIGAKLVFEQSDGTITIEVARHEVTGDRILRFSRTLPDGSDWEFAPLHANVWRALQNELRWKEMGGVVLPSDAPKKENPSAASTEARKAKANREN